MRPNSLLRKRPDLAKQWHPTLNGSLRPKDVAEGSNKKITWRHYHWKTKNWHIWKAKISDRTKKNNNCPYCANRTALYGFNDLKTTNPKLARQANGWDPKCLTPGSGKRMSWKCKLEHIWFATVRDRVSGQNCATCSGRHLLIGFNDLLTRYPKIAKELLYVNPKTLLPGSRKKLTWKCRLGHTWKNTVIKRTREKQNCPYCVGRSVWPGFNDIATTHSYLIQEIVRGNPTKVSAGSEKQFIWKCKKNHRWQTAVCNRTRGSGCPDCAISGFNPDKFTTLYLINKEQIIQFGITNDIKTRLAKHRRSGFINEPVALLPFRLGSNARALEVSLITLMRDYHVPTATQRNIKFDGSTEAFCVEDAMDNPDFLEEFKALVGL